MELLSSLLLMSCVAVVLADHHSLVKVNSSAGLITGMNEQFNLFGKNYELNVFRGIPYAEPPIRELRFKRPVKKARLPDGFNATSYGYGCPQAAPMDIPGTTNFSTSEDCLFLNIYAPVSANVTNKKPVMVFIHGGAWVVGASQQYDGRPMAAYGDVVLVTINYRLGPFGYLDTGDENGPGNNGLFDELLALHWVRDNIGEFGGDPGVVTVFGESAGGVETSLHAISPLSAGEGLLHRAIPQSGAAIFPYPSHFAIVKNHKENANILGTLLGCPTTDTLTMVECIRLKPTDDVITASNNIYTLGGSSWGPTMDGQFVPELPEHLFTHSDGSAYSAFSSIDLMVGSNSADGDVAYQLSGTISRDQLISSMSTNAKGIPNEEDFLKAVVYEYVPAMNLDGDEGRNILIDYFSDSMFIGPAVATAQTHAKMSAGTGAKSFMYFFDYALNILTSSKYRPGKAAHGVELFYLFFLPSLHIANQTSYFNMTEDDEELSKAMMTYWTNFAKYGNPNGNVSDPASAMADPHWPEFSLQNQQYLDIGSNSSHLKLEPKKDLHARKMSLWLDYLQFVMNQTCDAPATTQILPHTPCPDCPPLLDQQIGFLGVTVGHAQTVLLVLAVCTAVLSVLSLMLLFACCRARKQLKHQKRKQTYHKNEAFTSD